MKRYKFSIDWDAWDDPFPDEIEDDHGEWVKYEDVKVEIGSLKKQLSIAERSLFIACNDTANSTDPFLYPCETLEHYRNRLIKFYNKEASAEIEKEANNG